MAIVFVVIDKEKRTIKKRIPENYLLVFDEYKEAAMHVRNMRYGGEEDLIIVESELRKLN